MRISRPSSDGPPLPSRWRGARLTLALAVGLFPIAIGMSQPASAGNAEPLYYIYRGQQKQLNLDAAHIAVHVKGASADSVPLGLVSRGYTVADIESRPLGDWIVLRAHTSASGART